MHFGLFIRIPRGYISGNSYKQKHQLKKLTQDEHTTESKSDILFSHLKSLLLPSQRTLTKHAGYSGSFLHLFPNAHFFAMVGTN